jgi:hypothetical protein
MRRWFRKKDQEPFTADEAVSPETEELAELPQEPREEGVGPSPSRETGYTPVP